MRAAYIRSFDLNKRLKTLLTGPIIGYPALNMTSRVKDLIRQMQTLTIKVKRQSEIIEKQNLEPT